jgi:hypothetical protein
VFKSALRTPKGGLKEGAEKSEIDVKHPSGAKAPNYFAGFMRGLKTPASLRNSFFSILL